MESLSNILQHSWLTKKRKIMLGALLVFATCSSAYKWSAGGSYVGGAQPTSGHRSAVRAGGWICNTQIQAADHPRFKGLPGESLYKGCSQIGTTLYVNVFEESRVYFNGVGVVKVGNSGGVGWVEVDDLE